MKKKKKDQPWKCQCGVCDALSVRGSPAQANGSQGLFIFEAWLQFGWESQRSQGRSRQPWQAAGGALHRVIERTSSSTTLGDNAYMHLVQVHTLLRAFWCKWSAVHVRWCTHILILYGVSGRLFNVFSFHRCCQPLHLCLSSSPLLHLQAK